MTFFKIVVGLIVLVLFVWLIISSAPTKEEALRAVRDEGYTNAVVTDTSGMALRCSEDDSMEFSVSATNVKERNVKLIVCCGYQKGCTIRH